MIQGQGQGNVGPTEAGNIGANSTITGSKCC